MVTAIMQFSFHDEFLEIYDKYTTDIKKTQSVNNYEVVLATIIKGNVFRPPPPLPRRTPMIFQPRKPGSLYLRGLRLRPWWRLVTWDSKNLLPKGEREKCQITCFHIKTLHFICKERGICIIL